MQIKNLSVVFEGGGLITAFEVSTPNGWKWVGLNGNATAAAIIAAAADEIALAIDEEEMEAIFRELLPDEGNGSIESINDGVDGVGGGDYTPSRKDDDDLPF
jgi:hypothetical protein